jgi:hypothetical protein
MTRRPIQSPESRVANKWGWGAHCGGASRVQPSEKPVEQRTVRLFFLAPGSCAEKTFAFKAPKPVRQSRTTFAVPCQVECYSMDTLGLGIPHAGLVLLVRGVLFRRRKNQNTRSHRSLFTSSFAFMTRLKCMFIFDSTTRRFLGHDHW